jgi:hypothetical protein
VVPEVQHDAADSCVGRLHVGVSAKKADATRRGNKPLVTVALGRMHTRSTD